MSLTGGCLHEELIKQAIQKTAEKVDFVLLGWKGLGKEKTLCLSSAVLLKIYL